MFSVKNLYFHKEYQIFELEDSANNRKSGWWSSLTKPENTNETASILSNTDLDANSKDYVLLNLDFSPITIEEAIKVIYHYI